MTVKKWVVARRIVQGCFFALFILLLLPVGIDPLVTVFVSISERVLLPGLLLAAAMLFLSTVFGRFFCGWICPLGTLLDVSGTFARKERESGEKFNAAARKGKFVLLAVVAAASVAGVQIAWVLDPLGIVSRLVGTFPGSPAMLAVLLAVCSTVFIRKRFWCRGICPLGALYAITAKISPFVRRVRDCGDCKACVPRCRMGAIRDDLSYAKSECILCMDCIYDCLTSGTDFGFGDGNSEAVDPSRRGLLLLISSSVLLSGFGRFRFPARERAVIRPPAALPEDEFVDRCIRCGNCMRVCITNGLQPAIGECGVAGIWTPKLVPEIGYCEYNCTLCGNTCPTGAIRRVSLTQKHDTKLGLAVVDRVRCISWADGKQCMVCEEHCPVPRKAIKAAEETVNGKVIRKPVVDGNLCVGCGICQNKCPVGPVRAIRVKPF